MTRCGAVAADCDRGTHAGCVGLEEGQLGQLKPLQKANDEGLGLSSPDAWWWWS